MFGKKKSAPEKPVDDPASRGLFVKFEDRDERAVLDNELLDVGHVARREPNENAGRVAEAIDKSPGEIEAADTARMSRKSDAVKSTAERHPEQAPPFRDPACASLGHHRPNCLCTGELRAPIASV